MKKIKLDFQKTLFISDLDGTLLNADACLPAGDVQRINALGQRGVRITYATARTIKSVEKILDGIAFSPESAPVALMNGVLICDMASGHYVDSAKFSTACAQELLQCMCACGAEPFIYTVEGDVLRTYYREIRNEPMRRFMQERVERYSKPFTQIEDIFSVRGDVIYFCMLGGEDEATRVSRAVGGIPGIKHTSYRDSYAADTWYLEIFDERASKKHAVEFLRKYTGAAYVVCFGDNRNDLPMFEAADFAVAVENAVPELQAAADDIARGGVVEYIETMLMAEGEPI